MSKLYVHYGSGFHAPDTWLNFDASPTLLFESIPLLGRLYSKNEKRFPTNVQYGNIVKGLPHVRENSCDGVYCSHVLEHLSLNAALAALTNTYRLLKGDGIFRVVVPDLEIVAKKYIKEVELKNPNAAKQFQFATGFGVECAPRNPFRIIYSLFGNSRHLWMWDKPSLHYDLERIGFRQIRECQFNDSKDEM